MVDTPDVLELPSSPTQLASVNHESTMVITFASPDAQFDEPQAPDALIRQEKQADSPTQQPPPASSSVQFIRINYVPDTVEPQSNSQRLAVDPTPWESAVLPSPEDHTATRPSAFSPKRCAVPAFGPTTYTHSFDSLIFHRRVQAEEVQHTGFFVLFRTSTG
jgi:hypothetical protein